MSKSDDSAPDRRRRDFLYLTSAAVTTFGVGAAVWPMIDQLNPSGFALSQGAPADVDISKIPAGQQITASWRSQPIFVLRRTRKELGVLQETSLTQRLRDPQSKVLQQPAYADNWHRSIKPEFLVVVGICTHLGCVPDLEPAGSGVGANWPGGYFCPCHGSKYDMAGRVFQGVPAPYNLPVPPYHFPRKGVLRIGENPKGSKFNFASITQI
jgi:ubiquinol-cytochrome c reductase iron-sulfur subunit